MRRNVRTVRLKGLWIHPSGARYYRVRRAGRTHFTRLPDDLPTDHPDFIAAWAAAARQTDAPTAFPAGTLGSSWRALLASDTFHGLSEGYRAIIRREARHIVTRAGAAKVAAIAEAHVRADLRSTRTPSARLRAWRLWARFCLDHGWLVTDPTATIRLRTRAGPGHPAWTRDDIAAFRAAHALGTPPRAIMELLFWTGARISDAMLIGQQHVGRDGVLAFRQKKTGDLAYVPWTCDLPDYGRGMEADRALCHAALAHVGPAMTWLQTRSARPRSHKAAGHVIARAAQALGIAKSAHGLRKARAVALAESGATPAEIGAWTGHRSLSEIAHYTREMDRRSAVIGTKPQRHVDTVDEKVDTRPETPREIKTLR